MGDALLKEVGEPLRDSVRKDDTVARFGGDEFVLLLEAIRGEPDAKITAERIVALLQQPFELDGRTITISGSLGVALVHGSFDDEALMRTADKAMYMVKERGKAGHHLLSL